MGAFRRMIHIVDSLRIARAKKDQDQRSSAKSLVIPLPIIFCSVLCHSPSFQERLMIYYSSCQSISALKKVLTYSKIDSQNAHLISLYFKILSPPFPQLMFQFGVIEEYLLLTIVILLLSFIFIVLILKKLIKTTIQRLAA